MLLTGAGLQGCPFFTSFIPCTTPLAEASWPTRPSACDARVLNKQFVSQEVVLNIEPQEYLDRAVVSIVLASDFRKLQKPYRSRAQQQQPQQPTAQQVSAFASASVQHPFTDGDQPRQQAAGDVDHAGDMFYSAVHAQGQQTRVVRCTGLADAA